MIDEVSGERFIHLYMEQGSYSIIDSLKRCINYYGHSPLVLQIDNGSEFNRIRKTDRIDNVKTDSY